ncbi:MAG: extracellular solute-binding protein, partial [Vallitaleaceae bacterium]|nr:extracellular solute-binding protein [Vallitaleaceae bacterium]
EVLEGDLKSCLVDLNTLQQEEILNQMIPYSLQQIKGLNGEYFALPLDINPVTILYRRSIAKEVFGTDDLTRIEACFNGYEALLQAAEQLKDKEIKMFPDPLAFRHFANVGKTPWFDENGYYIGDAKKWKFLDTLKTLRVEGYTANAIEWSQDWFLGMKNELSQRVFAYVLPNWALKNIVLSLDENKEELADFAMIDGMIDHAWGGSYIALYKESEKQDLAFQFIKYLVADVSYLKNRVEETGLVSANQVANQNIIAEELSTFLGQQDYVQMISNFAKEVKLSIQEDEVLQKKSIRLDEMFQELIREFIRGDFHTVDEALASFEERVKTEFPELFPLS